MNYSWMNHKLEVREAGGGKGIFAKEAVFAGEKMALWGGRIITVQEEIGDWGIQIDDNFVIGGLSKHGEELEDADYINHSCNPNAGIKGQILLVAMRDITPDEEVVFDYAMCLYKGEDGIDYRFDCQCGANDCRGFITNEDWRNPKLQQKYEGYFSWYLQEKIRQLKQAETQR